MIRASIVSIVFLGVTLTLILLQPGSEHISEADRVKAQEIVNQAKIEYDAITLNEQPASPAPTATVATPTTYVQANADPSYSEPEQTDQPGVSSGDALAIGTSERTSLEEAIIDAVQRGQSEAYILDLIKQAKAQDDWAEDVTRSSHDHKSAFLEIIDRKDTEGTQPDFSTEQRHLVQPGDSLASISQMFYNSSSGAFDIFIANKDTMGSPDNIVVGQELVIPTR